MSRSRSIPDSDILAIVLAQLADSGARAVSFSTVSLASGLAPSTLVQRFGTRQAMVQAALIQGWDGLDALTAATEAEALVSVKGALGFLKTLAEAGGALAILEPSLQDVALRGRATSWRKRVELALVRRLGGGARGQMLATIFFAAWQGRQLWEPAGGKGFRLSDLARKID